MASDEQKLEALKSAIEIAKESARSGNTTPSAIIDQAYKQIVHIIDEIERGGN